MHDLTNYLLGSKEKVSSEDLKRFGLESSRKFLAKESCLNDAVSGFVREHNLNDEQTKRVVEFANNSTFKAIFEKQASKVVEFEVADVDEIQCRVASNPDKPSNSPEIHEKVAYIPGAESVPDLAEELFGSAEPLEKVAQANPNGDLHRAFLGLQDVKNTKESDRELAMTQCKQAEAEFCAAVKQTLLSDEGDLHDVLDAITPFSPGNGFLKMAMNMAIGHMHEIGALSDKHTGKEKTSSRQPDPNHPVAATFKKLSHAAMAVRSSDIALTNIDGQLGKLKTAATLTARGYNQIREH
jgi:hypothetical protein